MASALKFIALLCFCWAVAADPIVVPLTHNDQIPGSLNFVDDQFATVGTLVAKYTRATSPDDVALGGQSVIVTGDLTVGSSAQPFTVLLDTGSALLALPTSGCSCDSGTPNSPLASTTPVPCSASGCQACCASNVCPTDQCAFSVTYADNSGINGSLITDTVTFGGLSAQCTFGGITQETTGFVAPFADGIMGLSQNGAIACSPSCVTPVFDVYVQQGLVTNAFAFFLDFTGTGTLTLGGTDPSLASGPFVSTPLVGSDFYGVTLNALKLDGTTVATGFGQTILDTGTTLIQLPTSAYNALVSQFQNNFCNLVGTCGAQTVFGNNCLRNLNDALAYPNLQFSLDGVEITVPPRAYFLPTTDNGRTVYCLGINGWNNDLTILGYTFMRGQYIFFDRENTSIGFAGTNATLGETSGTSGGTTGPQATTGFSTSAGATLTSSSVIAIVAIATAAALSM